VPGLEAAVAEAADVGAEAAAPALAAFGAAGTALLGGRRGSDHASPPDPGALLPPPADHPPPHPTDGELAAGVVDALAGALAGAALVRGGPAGEAAARPVLAALAAGAGVSTADGDGPAAADPALAQLCLRKLHVLVAAGCDACDAAGGGSGGGSQASPPASARMASAIAVARAALPLYVAAAGEALRAASASGGGPPAAPAATAAAAASAATARGAAALDSALSLSLAPGIADALASAPGAAPGLAGLLALRRAGVARTSDGGHGRGPARPTQTRERSHLVALLPALASAAGSGSSPVRRGVAEALVAVSEELGLS
jgi:hypothetical protein